MEKAFPILGICNLVDKAQHPQDVLAYEIDAYLKINDHLVFPHRHDFYQILFKYNGGGSHIIDFEQFEIGKNEVHFLRPGQVHTWRFEGDKKGFIVNFDSVLFSTTMLNSNYLGLYPFFRGSSQNCIIKLNEILGMQAKKIFEQLVLESMKEDEFRNESMRSLLVQLFVLCGRVSIKDKLLSMNKDQYHLFQQFQNLVEQHFVTKRLPKEYAELLFLTPNYLNALCQKIAGQSAGDIIRQRVLLEAKRLLSNSEYNISQIGYALQFGDRSYFTKFFKKYEGVTPEQFKSINKII